MTEIRFIFYPETGEAVNLKQVTMATETTTTVQATQEAILKLTLAYDKEIHEEVSFSRSSILT